jgi:hypothetical protein
LFWLLCTHALAVIAILQLESTVLFKGVLLMALSLHFIWLARQYLLGRGSDTVQEAWVNHDGGWRLLLGSGETLQARLLPDSFVKPWLVVLRFKTENFSYPRSMVLFPDSLDRTVNRNLRIYLKVLAVAVGPIGE